MILILFAKYLFAQILCLTGRTHRHHSRSGKPLSGFSQKHPYLHRLKADHGHEQHPTHCRPFGKSPWNSATRPWRTLAIFWKGCRYCLFGCLLPKISRGHFRHRSFGFLDSRRSVTFLQIRKRLSCHSKCHFAYSIFLVLAHSRLGLHPLQ